MSLKEQNVVVLAYPRYQELDFWYPVLRGREEGATVRIVGAASTSFLGYPVIPDTEIADVDPSTVDIVIAPGVASDDAPAASPEQLTLVAAVHAAGGLVAGVGNGAAVIRAAVPDPGDRAVLADGTDDLAPFFRTVRAALSS